jgi:hypothetical protein
VDFAARRRDVASWAVAIASVTVAATVIVVRFEDPRGAQEPVAPAEQKLAVTSEAHAPEPPRPQPSAEPAPSARPAESARGVVQHAVIVKAPKPAPVPVQQPQHEAPTPEPSANVEPAVAVTADFDRAAARAALAIAAATASGCRQAGEEATGSGKVAITFAPAGRVMSALVVGAPFQGTRTGSCIASAFRNASVPAFAGDPVVVTKDVTIR